MMLRPREIENYNMPNWFKDQQPLYAIQERCVLKWPCQAHADELRVICPVHGLLSAICDCKKEKCLYCDCYEEPDFANLLQINKNATGVRHRPGASSAEIAILENAYALKRAVCRAWDHQGKTGLLPKLTEPYTGSPMKINEIRKSTVSGEALAKTPRQPCIVDNHSMRARNKMRIRSGIRSDASDVDYGHIYAYLDALCFIDEKGRVLRANFYGHIPMDYNKRHIVQEVSLDRYFPVSSSGGLMLRHYLPTNSWFVMHFEAKDFMNRPDIHVGDQVLELAAGTLVDPDASTSANWAPSESFKVKLRPCPFISWLTMRVGSCSIVDEAFLFTRFHQSAGTTNSSTSCQIKNVGTTESRTVPTVAVTKTAAGIQQEQESKVTSRKKMIGSLLQSTRDLGFTLCSGRVVSVIHGSPAACAGLKPDDHIIEVGDYSITLSTDAQIISLIRSQIGHSPSRSVRIGVMPENIFSRLDFPGKSYTVWANQVFDLPSWLRSKVFGVRSS